MLLQITFSLLHPLARIHSLERLVDLLVPVAESHNRPLKDADDVKGDALADPKARKSPTCAKVLSVAAA